ncbi:MAG: hypothetical protein J6T12_00480 [Salinivirgaceae bacterium]|nr:hypothetical protein [Salinivirgaceae bacterium]
MKFGDVLEFELISADSLNCLKKTQPKFCSSIDEFPKLAPQGYVYDGIICDHDFDNNGLTDYLLFIRATKRENFELENFWRGVERDTLIDRNPRGYLLAMNRGERFEVTSFNYECFPSANESGGVYFPPELEISPINFSDNEKGLDVSYSHGRYGYWVYSFKYNNGEFILTMFYRDESMSWIAESLRKTTINFETGEVNISELKNAEECADNGEIEPIYETKTDKINYKATIKMSQMTDI